MTNERRVLLLIPALGHLDSTPRTLPLGALKRNSLCEIREPEGLATPPFASIRALHEHDQASGDNVMSGRHRGHAAISAVPPDQAPISSQLNQFV